MREKGKEREKTRGGRGKRRKMGGHTEMVLGKGKRNLIDAIVPEKS